MPTERLKRVESTLAHYRVAAPVRFAPQPASVLGLLGPRAGDVLAAVGAELPAEPPEAHVRTRVGAAEVLVARASDLPGNAFVLHVGPDAANAVLDAVVSTGAALLDRSTLDVLRVEEGIPWYGTDVGEENLLHETGLVAIFHSPTKGCYLGQEVVARLEGRGGNVSKRLRGLRLETPCRAGTALSAGGVDAGRVTTAGVSPRFGPVAMAYVHRGHAARAARCPSADQGPPSWSFPSETERDVGGPAIRRTKIYTRTGDKGRTGLLDGAPSVQGQPARRRLW